MTRVLTKLNLLGVLALGALCAQQWRIEQRQDLSIDELTRTREQQADRIATQAAKLKDDTTDLADLRERLEMSETQMKTVQDKLAVATTQRAAVTAEREALKVSLAAWQKSVEERDRAIADLHQHQQQLTAARDTAITKFNDLAEKYNKFSRTPRQISHG